MLDISKNWLLHNSFGKNNVHPYSDFRREDKQELTSNKEKSQSNIRRGRFFLTMTIILDCQTCLSDCSCEDCIYYKTCNLKNREEKIKQH
jgi:hypothetical protein